MSLEYNDIKIEGKIRIGASSFPLFYENPKSFYKNQILKQNNFRGNTNTVIGSLIHSRIEHYWQGIPHNEDDEFNYVTQYKDLPEVNEWEVYSQVDKIWEMLQTEIIRIPKPSEIEVAVLFEIPNSDKYFIGGSYDYLRGNVIGDLKTTSTSQKSIKVSHRQQILFYELCRRLDGKPKCDTMEVIYIVKTKVPKLIVLQEPITEDDILYIKTEIKNMITRLELVDNNPDLVDVIFFHNSNSYLK